MINKNLDNPGPGAKCFLQRRSSIMVMDEVTVELAPLMSDKCYFIFHIKTDFPLR